jgi:hypothetical protein
VSARTAADTHATIGLLANLKRLDLSGDTFSPDAAAGTVFVTNCGT